MILVGHGQHDVPAEQTTTGADEILSTLGFCGVVVGLRVCDPHLVGLHHARAGPVVRQETKRQRTSYEQTLTDVVVSSPI